MWYVADVAGEGDGGRCGWAAWRAGYGQRGCPCPFPLVVCIENFGQMVANAGVATYAPLVESE